MPATESSQGSSDLIVGAMHDRASVNLVAMRIAKVIYQYILDIGCFSHTLDRVGENMKPPILDEFSKAWIGMFTRSPKTRERWRSLTGLPPPSYSVTRWWSRYEVLAKLMVMFLHCWKMKIFLLLMLGSYNLFSVILQTPEY